ncbi:MAG: Ig-like domain-containing protein [Kofleriaceae bacterium]
MIQQVRLKEDFREPGKPDQIRRVFAFGTHEQAQASEIRPDVTSAAANGQMLRVIMDELLQGNYIEEINCRGVVDSDAYDRLPIGATPDDVAACSTVKDILPETCSGPMAMCICRVPGGCLAGTDPVAEGMPVGVADLNQDGSADDTRMIAGAVGIRCGTIDVPLDLDMSYWNPSGTQQRPAMGGFDALGPALVLVPSQGMPTNLECGLTFSPEIVDKQGNQVCAPPNGDITQDCTPGDLSAFKFRVEPLILQAASPEDMATGVPVNVVIRIASITAGLDMATLGGITVTENGNPFTTFTMTYTASTKLITITPTTNFANGATVVVTVPTSVTDGFGQPLPAPFTLTFTTVP